MRGKSDLCGKRFGRLFVFHQSGERSPEGGIQWLCLCDCGTLKVVPTGSLKFGGTKSCGCLRKKWTLKKWGSLKINLTGHRFGRLKVISEASGRDPGILWRCVCDCGNQKTVRSSNLRSGNTKSCGCLQIEQRNKNIKRRHKNIIGWRFNYLTVMSIADRGKQNQIQWNCRCDCGKHRVAILTQLKNGSVKSCGCKVRHICPSRPKIQGNQYGYLTVLSENPKRTKSGNVRWECICDCGNYVTATTHSLRSGSTKSCGCYKIALNMNRHHTLTPEDLQIELVKAKIEERKVVRFLESFN